MDIDNMQAGRELDAMVAEKVFGLTIEWSEIDIIETPLIKNQPISKQLRDKYDEVGLVPFYSMVIEDAWLVVEKCSIHTLRRIVANEPDNQALWQAMIYADESLSGIADTAPLAICRAALKAVV